MSNNEGSRGKPTSGGPSPEELARATPSVAGGREVRIGIFVLIGAFATLLLLFLLTDPATFRGRYMVTTQMMDAGGVRAGDPVQMRGVNIGRVRGFEMRDPGVAIHLEINGQWSIPTDSRARLAGVGLLGGRTVEIVPGDAETSLPPGAVLPGESAEGILDVADALGEDALAIAGTLRSLLDEEAVEGIRASASDVDRLLQTLTAAAEEQRAELLRLSRSLSASAGEVEELLARGQIEQALARTDSTLATLQAVGARLDRATGSLETILQRVEGGEGTLGQLTTNDELYRNLSDAAEAILRLAEDVQENPSRYIRLRLF